MKAKRLSLVSVQPEERHLSSGLSKGANGHEAKCKVLIETQAVGLKYAVQRSQGIHQLVLILCRPTWFVAVVDAHEPNI